MICCLWCTLLSCPVFCILPSAFCPVICNSYFVLYFVPQCVLSLLQIAVSCPVHWSSAVSDRFTRARSLDLEFLVQSLWVFLSWAGISPVSLYFILFCICPTLCAVKSVHFAVSFCPTLGAVCGRHFRNPAPCPPPSAATVLPDLCGASVSDLVAYNNLQN